MQTTWPRSSPNGRDAATETPARSGGVNSGRTSTTPRITARPAHQSHGIIEYGWNAKEFSDVLGPLRRYLRKQVGRPWDKV